MFIDEAKDKLEEYKLLKDSERLEGYLIEHKNRYIQKLIPYEERPNRSLGQNGLNYIQLSLNRSRTLIEGCITSINGNNGLLALLGTRAHFEVTGALGYFYEKLTSFYSRNIPYKSLDEVLHRLTLGTRIDEVDRASEAINVMTLIDAADEYFIKSGKKETPRFREGYDYLSEFCHPNSLGIFLGADIEKAGTAMYTDSLTLKKDDFIFLNYLLMSVAGFLSFYDKIYNLLNKNEQLPEIVRRT